MCHDVTGYHNLGAELLDYVGAIEGETMGTAMDNQMATTTPPLPVLPDGVVRRALDQMPSETVMATCRTRLAEWIAQYRDLCATFSPDAQTVKALSMSLTQRGVLVGLPVTGELGAGVDRLLQHSALYDLYIQARQQDAGIPNEVQSEAPRWVYLVAGVALGGVVGWLGLHGLDDLFVGKYKGKKK